MEGTIASTVYFANASIVPDIGILASTGPVAIDATSLELVNQQQGIPSARLSNDVAPGEDKFKGVWNQTDGALHIRFGEETGLGTSSCEHVEL